MSSEIVLISLMKVVSMLCHVHTSTATKMTKVVLYGDYSYIK